MVAHAIFFYVFSIIAVISAIMVTVSKNTVHSVFFLILDFISISCLFIMIGAEFIGMIMLIVYVGAVAVLFLFVVMMLNVAQQENEWFQSKKSKEQTSSHIPVGFLISTIIFFELKSKPSRNFSFIKLLTHTIKVAFFNNFNDFYEKTLKKTLVLMFSRGADFKVSNSFAMGLFILLQ